MFKRMIIGLSVLVCVNVYADATASGDVANAQPKKVLNSPVVGSKSYNTTINAQPKLTGKKGEAYYNEKELTSPNNNPSTAGSKTYSQQLYPQPKTIGQKGKKYYTKDELSNGLNQPTQGSKIGSNQVFNYPGDKLPSSASK